MRRWLPAYVPPTRNARRATEEEVARIGKPDDTVATPKPAKAKAAAVKTWKKNPGRCPADAKGRRVEVKLANGEVAKGDPNPMSPPGWAADGPNGLKWERRGFDFDVDYYRVIK